MATSQMSGVIQHLRRTVLLRDGAGLTDGQLLTDYISRRDEAALAALMHRHGPMVWGVCRRVLRNYHDAEDAFQATFLVFVRKAASIASRELLANWLYGVAHQTALKARATAAKKNVRERQVTEMPEPAVAEQDLWNDLQPLLDEEVSRLPDKYRVVIVLSDLEGKTRKEVARQLGCPEGTVAGQLARARAMLAKRLSQRGVALSGGALVVLVSQNVMSACMPASVVSSTIKAATLFAAGQAAASGVIPATVASLTEGVVKAMSITKMKTAATVLLMVALAGLVAGGLIHRVLADEPAATQASADKSGQRNVEGLSTLSGKAVGVSKDGKTITLEMPPQERGGEAKRTDVKITDKTEITYNGVGLNGAKPTEGYLAHAWLESGSTDTAAKVSFWADGPGPTVEGKVVAVAKDGKQITLEVPSEVRDEAPTKTDIQITGQTEITFYGIGPDGAKLMEGYGARVWRQEGATAATRVMLFGSKQGR